MGELSIESSAFSSGGEIPKKYGYKNDNVNPPIKIRGVHQMLARLLLLWMIQMQ